MKRPGETGRAVVIAANHMSTLETVIFLCVVGVVKDATYVVKKSIIGMLGYNQSEISPFGLFVVIIHKLLSYIYILAALSVAMAA